jgi:hypothetical protein
VTAAVKGVCVTCSKRRNLVTYSAFDAWDGDPDQCLGCGSGVQHWATVSRTERTALPSARPTTE